MSQYFYLVFNCINCVLICVLFNVSFCSNNSLEILVYNNSSLEVFYDLNFNSSVNNQISNRSSTSLNLNEVNDYPLEKCQEDKQCNRNQKCCTYCNNCQYNKKFCIKKEFDENCKGYYLQECHINQQADQCEFDLYCKNENNHEVYGQCKCKKGYSFVLSLGKCVENENQYDPNTAMQIYKITMIFASCCLALILIIFLVCILRKSYCAPRRRVVPLDNTTIPDIFTLFPHVGNYDGGPLADGTLPPFEKPPTYDETLTLIRNEIGIPPPAYRTGTTPNSSNPSTPEMSSRFLISNPSLFTVSNHTNSSSRTSSDSNLASDESIAGPSGCGSSRHQGIDNPAFC